jgi:hypothetical protein
MGEDINSYFVTGGKHGFDQPKMLQPGIVLYHIEACYIALLQCRSRSWMLVT